MNARMENMWLEEAISVHYFGKMWWPIAFIHSFIHPFSFFYWYLLSTFNYPAGLWDLQWFPDFKNLTYKINKYNTG